MSRLLQKRTVNENFVRKSWAPHPVFTVMFALVMTNGFSARIAASEKSDETKSETPQKLEKVEVTGSRIERLDAETISPIVIYSAESIAQKGYDNLGEFIQSLPFNSGGANSVFQSQSNTFAQGAVTANPRGLGGNRFLVLVNGRRAVTYALTVTPRSNSIFDFSGISLAAIDHIEYLKDGASALYGSDAITGVMNIKLKRDFSGVETEIYAGNVIGHDNLRKKTSIVAGVSSGKTSADIIFSYSGMNASYYKDYNRTKSVDYSYLGPKGTNQTDTSNWPANVNFTAAQAAAAGLTRGSGYYIIDGGIPTSNPVASQFVFVSKADDIPNANRYDLARTLQVFPDQDSYSVYSQLDHRFNDSITGFAEFRHADIATKYVYSPYSVTNGSNPGTGPAGFLNIPPTNPYNPFGINITDFRYQGTFGPPRLIDIEAVSGNYLAGLKGKIRTDWTWEGGFAYGYNRVNTTSRNEVRPSDFQAALNGTTRQTALNPFGPSDNPELVLNLYAISNSGSKASALTGDFITQLESAEFLSGDQA